MSWIKFEGNPVFGNQELGTCFDVDVHRIGEKFRMYFSWRPRKAIAMVEGTDGIHWGEPRIVLEPRPESGWEDRLNRSCCLWRGGLCHLWYTGQSNGSSRIGHTVSKDGIRFENREPLPVMIPELPWEKESVMNPFVLFNEEREVYQMWYAGGETYEPNAIGYAESSDAVHWRKCPFNPIFVKGDAPCERDRIGACHIERLPDGEFLMYYIGYEDINTARICVAKSPDGITRWRRCPENPIVDIGEPGSWDQYACYKPSVYRDPGSGVRMLWYNGRNGHNEFIGLVRNEAFDTAF